MDVFIVFTLHHLPLLLVIFHYTKGCSGFVFVGTNMTAVLGDNKVMEWTMDPLPSSSSSVAVIHPSGATVFTAIGTSVIPSGSDISDRVTNTGNTNTNTGHIEFTLKNITGQDAGNYLARYTRSGIGNLLEVGITLYVYFIPSKPNIVEEATSVVGSTLVLNCSVTSNSKPDGHSLQMHFTWYRNGVDLPDEDRYVTSGSNLQVKNIHEADKDTVYTCRAYETTFIPSDVGDGYTVIVKYGPNVVLPNTAQQHILMENSGSLGPIKCSADCVPACTYQWMFDGADFDSSSDTLTINNIQRTSTGTYWCKAFNDFGTSQSKNVAVTVQYGPNKVSPERSNHYVLVENSDTLGPIPCNADCEPVCTYQWKFDGSDFGSSGDTLTIYNIQRRSAGTYWCVASNDYGISQSQNTTVTVQYRPDTVLPNIAQEHTLIENTDSLGPITCSADCEPGCTYQWMLNGEIQVAAGDTLTINNIQRTSAGTYWCIAANKHGAGLSKHVTAIIYYAPDNPELTSSAETAVTENTPLSIICSTHGVPLPNITIKSVERNGKHYVKQSSTNYTVTIQRADCRDTGRYICVAENNIGKSSSKEMNINITCLPKQRMGESRIQTVWLEADENLNMKVNLISNPLATVYWSFSHTGQTNKQRLVNNTKGFVVFNNDGKVLTQSTMTRHSMRLEYFGEYMLHASNPLGSTYVSFNVLPKYERQNTEQSPEGKSMLNAGAAMLAIGLVLIILAPIITVILLRRNSSNTNSSSQDYEDIEANLPPRDTSQDKDYQEMEPISSLYQGLGPQELPTVYEKLETNTVKGGVESQYTDITIT